MNNTYYQDELRYLREVGPEFARANPEIARLLSDRGSDPDVERLLEGVAFLCGRIRQKLDDELPEFTANMMGAGCAAVIGAFTAGGAAALAGAVCIATASAAAVYFFAVRPLERAAGPAPIGR